MASVRRIGRWVLVGLAAVGAGVLLLRVGAGVYLHTSGGREAVAQRLGSMIGLPVEVTDVDLGSRTSSIKFRVLDPALGTSPNAEILSVDSATADVSFADIITGRANPKEVHLRGISASVRLDATGKILTTLPTHTTGTGKGEIPAITLDGGRVTVRQEGRPEFHLSGLSLKADPAGDKLVLSGAADDPSWGKWQLSGEVEKTGKTGWVDVATDDAAVTPERLKSIPYIPLSVWENVLTEGRVKAACHFALGTDGDLKYDVRVQTKGIAVGVPAAEITVTEVIGLVRVHDGVVEVSGAGGKPAAVGKLAGGTITLSGKWDYGKDPAVGDPIVVTADHLAVKDLPAKWGLKNVGGLNTDGGFLSGSARIKLVAYKDGRVETYGGGKGDLELPHILGGQGKIEVTLGGNGQRLNFNLGGAAAPPPAPVPAKKPGATRRARLGPTVAINTPGPDAPDFLPSPLEGEGPGVRGKDTLRVEITTERELLALVAFLAVQPKADPARTDQTGLNATITLRDIDVAQFIEQLQLKLPYKIAGRVTVQAKLGVPLGQATTRSAYRLTGTLTSPELRFEGLTVRDVTTEVSYQNGTLTLTTLRGKIPQPGDDKAQPGEFTGSASAATDPPGDVTATLTLARIPLAQVVAAVPGLKLQAAGLVSGKAEFKAPFDKVSDPTTWAASAAVHSDEMTIAGRTAKAVSLTAVAAKGTVTLKDTAATIEGIPLTAAGTLVLTGKYPFDATVKTTGTSVADLRKLVPEAQLPVPVEGVLETESKVVGTLSPLSFTASGRVTASKLTLDKAAANHLDVKWELTQDRLKLTDLDAGLFGGTLTGSLDYPLRPDKTGAFALSFKDVDAAAAAAFVPDFPVRITGAVSGKVTGTIPAANEGHGRVGAIDLDLTAPKLTVQNIPAERLVGKMVVKNGAIDYSLEGKTLGGSFEIKGRYPGPGKKDPAPKPERGSLRITDVDLAQLAGALKTDSLKPLRGRVDVTFDFENDLSSGAGRVAVRGLGWGDESAGQELTGVILLGDGMLELRDLTGSIARGYLRARGRVRLDHPARNFLSVSIDRADAARLLAPVPGFAGVVTGEVSVVIRGTVGREMHGSGSVTIARGTLGGVEVAELHVPFDYSTAPGGYGRIAVREASTRAGTGRATADLTVEWGVGMRVGGQVRFIDVPVRALSRSLAENSFIGTGRLTGRVDLSGTNVQSADDLTGSLVASLRGTSVREIPLLQTAVPYLNPLGVTKPFQTGDVRGTLSRGVFRVQRLALANPSAQLFADGSITVKNGRLDLGVVAHTGPVGPQAAGFRLLALRLPPMIGPIPVGLIRDVSTFVSNRTIRLTITGTVANPVVQVNTAALLSEEAVRFFLTRYGVPADVGAALGLGGAGVLGGTAMPRR
ncbi:MAG: putative assembly protein [Gemmataceae bacterium]|nr:putative assembly protein [Gemmataceae bacterium]